MWIRARVADPAVAPVLEIRDGTTLVRFLREGDLGGGPILAPLTAAALAGTARAIATMDVDACTNALSAIAELIGRARPASGAVRFALSRTAPILTSAQPASVTAAALDRLADELAAELRAGNAHLARRLAELTATDLLLAGTWSRQSLGDPWLAVELLGDRDRTIAVAQGGATGEWELVAGWVDPVMRRRLEVIPDVAIAATLRARRFEAVLLLAEVVRPDGTIAAAPGSLAVALIASHYSVPVFVVDPASAFMTRKGDRPAESHALLPEPSSALVDLVPAALITQTITAP
jgi:methylthioribose-1-phosphate isomerase